MLNKLCALLYICRPVVYIIFYRLVQIVYTQTQYTIGKYDIYKWEGIHSIKITISLFHRVRGFHCRYKNLKYILR